MSVFGKISKGLKDNLGISNSITAPADLLTGGAVSRALGGSGSISQGIVGDLSAGIKPGEFRAADPGQLRTNTEAYLNPSVDQFYSLGQQSISAPNIDPAFRNYQLGLAQQLQQQASGQGPSIAQMQLQQATDRTMGQSAGLIRAATGATPGLAGRTAALLGAQQLGAAGNASGQLRLQEQQQAQQALAGLSAQARGADIDTGAMSLDAQKATAANRLAAAAGGADVRGQLAGMEEGIYNAQNGAAGATTAGKNQFKGQVLGSLASLGATYAGAKS